jgi:hypothetical protein
MKPSFHEDFSRQEKVEGSSDRSFGLTVGGILVAIAGLRSGLHLWAGGAPGGFEGGLAAIGVILLAFGLIAPARLAPANRAWAQFGLLLFKVINPVLLGVIYLTTIVPIGVLIRVLGRDPLDLQFDRAAASYWVVRTPPGPAPETMTQQF